MFSDSTFYNTWQRIEWIQEVFLGVFIKRCIIIKGRFWVWLAMLIKAELRHGHAKAAGGG